MSGFARRLQQASAVQASGSGTADPTADAGSLAVGTANYAVPGGALFVATTGNDSNAGTVSAPFQTLAKAVTAAASSGTTIVMRAGTYNEGEDTQDQAYPFGVMITKSLTIQNYPNETVWFDGSVPVTNAWTQIGSTWNTPYDRIFDRSPTFQHGQADGAGADTGAGGYFLTSDNPQACWPDMVLFDGAQLAQVQTLAEVATGNFFIEGAAASDAYWFAGTKLHIGDNPSGHEVRFANKCKLATFAGTTNTSTLRGVGIRCYASFQAGFGVLYLQHAITLENVSVEDISSQVISFDSVPSANIQKVTAQRIGFDFCGSNKSNNIVIDRVNLQQCNYAGFFVYGPSVAVMKFAKTQYVTLKNSIIVNNNTSAFWTDQTVNTPIVINSLLQDNTDYAVDFETSSDAILANCKIIHNGSTTVFVNDSDTSRIWNCTLVENNWGYSNDTGSHPPLIQIGQSSRRYDVSLYSYCIDTRLPSSYYSSYPQHQWTINSFEICNNVMARAGVNTYSMVNTQNNNDATRDPNRQFLPDMHPTLNSNIYHWGSNQPQYPWVTAKGYNVNPAVYFSLASFQAATGMDSNSTFATNDPLNTDLTLKDPTVHSKAIGLPTDIAALIGQPAGSKHIGCFW